MNQQVLNISEPILYWDIVNGHWRWTYAAVGLLIVFILLLVVISFLLPEEDQAEIAIEGDIAIFAVGDEAEAQNARPHRVERVGGRLRIFAMSFWTMVILYSISIWIDTTWHKHGQNPYALILFMCLPLIVIVLTFTLEGLEAAYTELRDKDRQQFEGRAAARAFDYIRKMGDESFFDAREWAIIALLVWATLLIEQEVYFLPFMGQVDGTHKIAFALVRTTLTVALTAFALVWVAQSPGKFVARKNSVEFLSYSSLLPLKLLNITWKILRFLGLQYPSQVANKVALDLMPLCKTGRKLQPSNLTFFADGLKKYGYGFLISDDILSVNKRGGIKLTSKTLHYIGDPRVSVRRTFSLEKKYLPEVLKAIEEKDPSRFSCSALVGPPIGERARHADINLWEDIFYNKHQPEWHPAGYAPYATDGFSPTVRVDELPDPNRQGLTLFVLEVRLNFRQNIPELLPEAPDPRSLLVLVEMTVETEDGAFSLPLNDEVTVYPYSKKHSHPCLRSSFTAKLPPAEEGAPEEEFVFVNTNDPDHFRVDYDGVRQMREEARFFRQRRDPDFESKIPGSPVRNIDAGLGQELVCFMDSSLPAAQYLVYLKTQRKLAKRAFVAGP